MKPIIAAVSAGVLLFCSAAIEAAQTPWQTQASIVAEFIDKPVNILSENGDQLNKFEYHIPDASFIKLHFGDFRPRAGTVVEVRNPDGTESYLYSRQHKDAHTFNRELGDDGITSFSAMSISGDTVIVEVHPPSEAHTPDKNNPISGPDDGIGVFVDHFLRGYSNDELDIRRSMTQAIEDRSINRQSDGAGFAGETDSASNCGADDRLDTVCLADSDPAAYDRSGPVAKILVGSSACTAWRVGPDNRMFTNHHCINSDSLVSATEVWFNYEKSVCGGDSTETVIKVGGDQLLSTDQTLDYTLFTVNDFDLIEPFGNLGLEIRDAVLDEEIYIPQHGSGDPKQLSLESDVNIGGVCRVDAENHDGLGLGTDVGYYCDTAGGSSGAPVILTGSNKAIALHHHGGCLNSGVKMSLIWPKVKRHFKRVVPQGDYDGPPSNPDPDPPGSAPTAAFSFACNGLSCSFNGSGSSDSDGSIVDYSWDFADDFNEHGANVSHSYDTEGSYGVTLTVTDNDDLTASTTRQVTLASGPGDQIELIGAGNKSKGKIWADLSWSGVSTNQVQIYRDGETLVVAEYSASFRDESLPKNTRTAFYRVCEYSSATCSNIITINF